MKALLFTVVLLCGAIDSVVAQKRSTLFGDLVIGELTGRDEATREITLKYPGKEGTEIFSGILADGYKLKMGDDGLRDLNLSEVVPGVRIRVFYKARHEKVNGQKKKINKISRIDVLGKDEYVRLRKQLNVDPSTTVVHAEKDNLPAISPLKVYLVVPYNSVHEELVAWTNKWNRKNGDSYGKLELVSDLEQADILIVVARGSDTMSGAVRMQALDGSGGVETVWSAATSYLVVKDAGHLKVLWTRVAAVFSGPYPETSPRTTESVIAEMEKRLKARAHNSKK